MFEGVNLEKELNKQRDRRLKKGEEETLKAFQDLLMRDDQLDQRILTNILGSSGEGSPVLNIEQLSADRIYSIDDIKAICVRYRLRFLDAKYFKGEVPNEAISRVKRLQKDFDVELDGYKILAPAELFNLKEKDKDPLLLVPVGQRHYYLIHRWGGELNPMRRIMSWPLQRFQNMVQFVFGLAFTIAMLMPHNVMVTDPAMASWPIRGILFFWLLIAFSAMAAFFTLAMEKNFNDAEWNSRYRV